MASDVGHSAPSSAEVAARYARSVSTGSSAAGSANERLSRHIVLTEGIALLDDVGFDALTMRRLADRLGVVPMALYRHVANKHDLVAGLLDLAVSFVPIPPDDLPWRHGLGQLARSIRRTMLAHPGIVTPVMTQPTLGPHSLLLAEYGLGLLRRHGFSDEVAVRAPNAVITYTLGFVALEVPRLDQANAANAGLPQAIEIDYGALPVDVFPHTLAVRPAPEEFVSDAQFEYGLERILDGIAVAQP